MGNSTLRETQVRRDAVGLFKARLANDRVAFAQIHLRSAEALLNETKIRRQTGLLTMQDEMAVDTAYMIAKLRLKEAEERK